MKILVLRFSSIGDIVLTTPVVRALAQQVPGAQVHFATKPAYRGLLEPNPHIAKVHVLSGSLRDLVRELRAEKFDFIVDLHHNLRTRLLKLQLNVKSASFDKLNRQKWLLVNFKINTLPQLHVVDRYLAAAAPLGVRNDGRGLDYFIPDGQEIDLQTLPAGFQRGYVAVAIGAQHATKRLPVEKLIELCAKLNRPIVLLGGPEDESTGHIIELAFTEGAASREPTARIPDNPYYFPENSPIHPFTHSLIHNGCGRYSLHQSASLLRQAQVVHIHMAVQLMRGVQLEHINLADQALVQAPVVEVIHGFETPVAQAWRRQVGIHRLPSRAQVKVAVKLFTVLDLVRKASRAFGARVRLVHEAVLGTQQRDGILFVAHVVHGAVLRVGTLERVVRAALHKPVDRLWEHDAPVTAQVGAHLFAGDQREVRVGLRAARVEVRL